MPATYEPIATTTLSTTATEINFNSITSSYTDLRISFIYLGNATVYSQMQLNAVSTGSLYSWTNLRGNGTAASSARFTNQSFAMSLDGNAGATTTIPAFVTVDLFNYAGSTNKTALITVSIDKNGSGEVTRSVGLFRSTSAISSIKLLEPNGNSFAAGTTATLYGILKA